MGENLTDEEKATIARRFIAHAPPGEFNEVFNGIEKEMNLRDKEKGFFCYRCSNVIE